MCQLCAIHPFIIHDDFDGKDGEVKPSLYIAHNTHQSGDAYQSQEGVSSEQEDCPMLADGAL